MTIGCYETVRFWNSYSDAIRQFAALKGGDENADDIVMTVLGKLVDVLRNGQYTPEKGKFHSYLATGTSTASMRSMDGTSARSPRNTAYRATT